MDRRINHWRNAGGELFEDVNSSVPPGAASSARRAVNDGHMTTAGGEHSGRADRVVTLNRKKTGKTRDPLEVDMLLHFASQVMPLKLLSERVRRALCEQADSASFEPGQLICRKGEEADLFFVILSGSVQVFLDGAPEDNEELATGISGRDRDQLDDASILPDGRVVERRGGASAACERSRGDHSGGRAASPVESSSPPGSEVGEANGEGFRQVTLLATLHAGEGFGHACLTEDECPRKRLANCRALQATSCMCVSHELYLTVQEQEEERMFDDELQAQVAVGGGPAGVAASQRRATMARQGSVKAGKSVALSLPEAAGADAGSAGESAGSAGEGAAGGAGGGEGPSFRKQGKRRPSMLEATLMQRLEVPGTLSSVIEALQTARERRTGEQAQRIADVAQKTRFFLSLDHDDIMYLSGCMRHVSAYPHQCLIKVGDEADKFFIVLRGALQVGVNGKKLAAKRAGDSFGELALLSSERRSADVVALTPCDLAVLSRRDILERGRIKADLAKQHKLALINANRIFGEQSESLKHALLDVLRPHVFRGGEQLVTQGSPSEEVFLLTKGTCVVLRTLPYAEVNGAWREATLHVNTISQGEIFGELGVLRNVPRTASVVAKFMCEVLAISRIDLSRLLNGHPELRESLTKAAAEYPTDAEHVRTCRYDGAWAAYRGRMSDEVTREVQVPHSARLPYYGAVDGLPPFRAPGSAEQGAARLTRRDDLARMFPWANEFLETHVLPSLLELAKPFRDEPEPLPYVRQPSRCESPRLPRDGSGPDVFFTVGAMTRGMNGFREPPRTRERAVTHS